MTVNKAPDQQIPPCGGSILVADSGSTKTDWRLLEGGGHTRAFTTSGLNPHHCDDEELQHRLAPVLEQIDGRNVHRIHFYGSGCTRDQLHRMILLLRKAFRCQRVEVKSDMVGAARAASPGEPALVAILGTGSNLCYWDGRRITPSVPSLGYILGDEGSGSHIGRQLLRRLMRGQLPGLNAAFYQQTRLTDAAILDHLYRLPGTGAWLASLVPFCVEHRRSTTILELLTDCFNQFLDTHSAIIQRHPHTPLHFIGSIGTQFRPEIKRLLLLRGIHIGQFIPSPIEGLEKYHLLKDFNDNNPDDEDDGNDEDNDNDESAD